MSIGISPATAVANGEEAAAEFLLDSAKANLFARTKQGQVGRLCCISVFYRLQTPLHIAARYDHPALCVFLLSKVPKRSSVLRHAMFLFSV